MEKAVNHGDTAGTAKSKDKNDFRFLRFKLMCRDPMEKAVNHGDTAGTAKSKDKNDFRFLLFAVPAVSPWLKSFSFAPRNV
ncbi:hypothetical protein FACS1894158_02760 [Betaproteobacteria bacterium]|nr:hypothetical protein FACS1894158_02760 [Betaproteobacteria bacterium]